MVETYVKSAKREKQRILKKIILQVANQNAITATWPISQVVSAVQME